MTKYRIVAGIAFILSLIGIIVYFIYGDIKSIDDIRVGWGLAAGMVFSLAIASNYRGITEKRIKEDKMLVTGFERFTKFQLQIILVGVIVFIISISLWTYCVLR